MSSHQPIISAEGLGKAYRIGTQSERHTTFRDAIVAAAGEPLRRWRQRHQDASKAPDAFWAIKDIRFQIDRGETIGIIGRNGAGKSTLLKVLSRIVEPTEGRAVLRGRVASLLEVGTGFHPELSGRENIYLNGAILGMRRTEISRKFDQIVEFSEVGKFLDTPVKRYSSGMYVRLAFAVAAHLEPEILIVDEVLAVGDAAFQKKCLGKMSDVVRQGRTVLFVSHNMDAVMGLCSGVYLVKQGRISERLTTNDGVKQYLQQVNEDPGVPLAQRNRWQHVARPYAFTDLKIRGGSTNSSVVEAGAPVTFEVTLGNVEDIPNLMVGVALHNDRYHRVVLFHSEYNGRKFFKGRSNMTVTCHVPTLPLAPGPYHVELVMGDGYHVLERVERADRMNVVFSDYFGTGKIPHSHQSNILLNAEWDEKR